jgi:hypothetical protein
METSQATIAQRSYTGCRTCRQRKVKCDENRDEIGRCNSCSRLNRPCDWTREWKFIDTSRDVEKQYIVLGKDPHGAVKDDRPGHATVCTTALPIRPRPLMFINSSSGDLAATMIPAERRTPRIEKIQDPRPASDSSSDDSDTQSVELIQAAQIPFDMMNYGTRTRDNAIHPLLFDRIVCRKIMPMAVRFKLNIEDNQNVLVSSANQFPPLRHAICAITLLNSGMKNRPELIAGSFQHYDQAITACRSMPPSTNPEAVFFLHFILLMYDIACASQRWPEDRSSWALHLRKLACLAHAPAQSAVGRLKAYLSWYVLLLDAQAGLAGNPEAGYYTRAFLENGRSLPVWPISQSQQTILATPEAMDTFLPNTQAFSDHIRNVCRTEPGITEFPEYIPRAACGTTGKTRIHPRIVGSTCRKVASKLSSTLGNHRRQERPGYHKGYLQFRSTAILSTTNLPAHKHVPVPKTGWRSFCRRRHKSLHLHNRHGTPKFRLQR